MLIISINFKNSLSYFFAFNLIYPSSKEKKTVWVYYGNVDISAWDCAKFFFCSSSVSETLLKNQAKCAKEGNVVERFGQT